MKNKIIIANPDDNVGVAVQDIIKGTDLDNGLVSQMDIPQAHKIALSDIAKNESIIRYGVVLGMAVLPIKKGELINENSLDCAELPNLDQIIYEKKDMAVRKDIRPPRDYFYGYRNKNNFAGTRNLLGIMTTVQCVAGIMNQAVSLMKKELLPKYPHVEDIVVINHAYGCGVAIDAREAHIPKRALANMMHHPNFGGQTMLVGLGCEKLTPDMITDEKTANNAIILQDIGGYEAMLSVLLKEADLRLKILNERRREKLQLSELIIGLQCGGSDAFSGISANPVTGYASDLLINGGATVLFSEVTEVRDAVQFMAERCETKNVFDKLISEMKWYDQYLIDGGVDRTANPSPGNKQGGLSNIVEKAMGSVAKSGTSTIVDVITHGEVAKKKGLIFAATPASDIVCGPMQLASGITLQVFMTGRGTPYGLSSAPVIKVCSRNEMYNKWSDIIDFSAGNVATGETSLEEAGVQLFELILDVASGDKITWSEKWGIYNDFCVFNPAPIT